MTALALASSTIEVCGFAILKYDGSSYLYPCTNIASDPTQEYEIDTSDFINASKTGRIVGIYHSHPKGPSSFSETDIEYANELGLPQWMYSGKTETWHEYIPPTYFSPPFEGRQWAWGIQDCHVLLRDYYRQSFQIYLSDYDRDETSDWVNLGKVVLQNIEREGFTRLPPGAVLQKNDILIFNTNGAPIHFCVFIGNSTVLHHPLGALSRKDQYNSAWQRRLHTIARYNKRSLG